MTVLRQSVRRLVPAGVRMRLRPPPAWTVSVLRGADPLALSSSAERHVVLDEDDLVEHGLALAADPFALPLDGGWVALMETLPQGGHKAQIALCTSPDARSWRFHGPVLAEPFHLSYPRVLLDGDDAFLVPESYEAGEVRLYRATDFPFGWRYEQPLLTGPACKDATPFTHDGWWWMLVETSAHAHDELRLFHSSRLRGPWREHRDSPVVRGDASAARPAGPPIVVDGRLVRLAQDCARGYGGGVRGFEILELNVLRYRERPLPAPVREPDAGWCAGGTHHLDAHEVEGGWLALVDGHR